MGIGRSIRNDCLRHLRNFLGSSLSLYVYSFIFKKLCLAKLYTKSSRALIELRTSFDGYELLRSNDEVEETVSSQFIGALRMLCGLQFAAGKFGELGALAFYQINARKKFFSVEFFGEVGEAVRPSV